MAIQAENDSGIGTSPDDPIFAAEQAHLSEVHAELSRMREALVRKMEATSAAAAKDKLDLLSEISNDFTSDTETSETYASYGAVNSVIDSYNAQQEATADKLARCRLLLRQPYFAKVCLRFKPGQPPKELYIGAAGISDENYKRLVVDWRSPVAETYYNQSDGATSYVANGRTIHAELTCRRQFDIDADTLNAYFDTTVAIQDALLLESLSHQRTAQMKAITATIQREQNEVVRHEDVPALLVAGIAGSGKTSVLLQRIAYLFYQNRTELDPSEVFLITPNPVFRTYIENVLPDMGERNPETLTWAEFASRVMPSALAAEKKSVPIEAIWRIDDAVANLQFEDGDFRELAHGNVKLLGISQIRKVNAKYRNVPAGPHRATLMREDLEAALEARVKQLASGQAALEELEGMTLNEQLSQFGEPYAPVDEREARDFALRLLQDRYQGAYRAVRDDTWLRVDRIGMRLLGEKSLSALEWLYLKMAITGLGDPYAKYVMIDEVQDYSAAQLAVLARFFRRAHFMLLGDENQAINPNTASFAEVREVFTRLRGGISTCSLLTSYRSSPEITAIFAGLLPEDQRAKISSVQRASEPVRIEQFNDESTYAEALRATIEHAKENDGLTAIVVPWKHEAKRLRSLLGDAAEGLIDMEIAAELPASGAIIITLQLAKGLEFDHVVVPDASERIFPEGDRVAKNRLYTTVSRATRSVEILSCGEITPLLKK